MSFEIGQKVRIKGETKESFTGTVVNPSNQNGWVEVKFGDEYQWDNQQWDPEDIEVVA